MTLKGNMVTCTAKHQKWATFSVSVVCVLLGILIVVLWNGIFQMLLKHELSLANTGTKGYTMWRETPIPMYLQFYIFNWTNAEEVIKDPSIKPHFEERGPYTYHEHHIRKNVTFNDNNTITFQTQRIWKFLPDETVGSLQDNITMLNPIVVTIGNLVKNKHYLVRRGVNFFFEEKHVKLAITKTVNEIIFDGYEDPMLNLVHKLNITGFNVPFTKFGWFVERNGSIEYDGVYNMNTGTDDIEKLGIVRMWNYMNNISYLSEPCSKIEGTTGELWYPPENNSSVKLFSNDLCSSVELTRDGDFTIYGVVGNKYIGTEKIFDNGTLYEDMKCFIPEGVHQPSGVRNVSMCKFGAPAFVSYAHFYLADPSYRDAVEGMTPSKEKHEMYLALEPNTGLPMRVQASFQINLRMDPVEGINLLANVKPTLMPAFWFKQTAELSKELTNEAKVLLVLPSAGLYTGYGILGIGILVGLIGIILTFRKGWTQSEEEQLLNQQTS